MIPGAMTGDILVVPRAPFDMEEPWVTPAAAKPVRLRRSSDGAAPRLSTSVAVWYDAEWLMVLFSSADDAVYASHIAHDSPLYEQDVVEVFVAPAGLRRYFEIEVSPRGTIFDARIDSPDGVRSTMDVDREWNCEGLLAAVRKETETDGEISIDTVIRIPFSSLGQKTPLAGEEWRANFFRIDRHEDLGDEFSAWQPTMRDPADFHVAAAFGVLRFS